MRSRLEAPSAPAARKACSIDSSSTPLPRSWCASMRGPKRRALARMETSAKRASESQPSFTRASRTPSRSSPSCTFGASLRRNSSRECSRRARRRMARARRLTGAPPFGGGSCADVMYAQAMRMATTKKTLRGLVGLGRLGVERHAARDADGLADLALDLVGDGGVLAQELAAVVLALADLLALVGVPGAGFFHDAMVHAHLDDLALARDALVVEDVEVGDLEGRSDLVLHHLHAGLVADDLLALLDGAD